MASARNKKRLHTVEMLRIAADQLEAKKYAEIIDSTYFEVTAKETAIPLSLQSSEATEKRWKFKVSVFAVCDQ